MPETLPLAAPSCPEHLDLAETPHDPERHLLEAVCGSLMAIEERPTPERDAAHGVVDDVLSRLGWTVVEAGLAYQAPSGRLWVVEDFHPELEADDGEGMPC